MEQLDAQMGMGIEKRLCAKATAAGIPISGTLELSPICNMSCEMCYARLDAKECGQSLLSGEQWAKIGSQMQEAGTVFVMLTGGEPLLYPDFKMVYRSLYDRGMVLTVNTNGTLLTEEWAEFFAAKRPRRINVTLYGMDEKTYEDLCHFGAGFERTKRAIGYLKQNKVDVKMNVSLTGKNIRQLERFYAFGEEIGVPVETDCYMFPVSRTQKEWTKEDRLSPQECARAHLFCMEKENPLGKSRFLEDCRKSSHGILFPNHTGIQCRAGRSSFFIDFKGEMRPCFALQKNTYNVCRYGFAECWERTAQYVKSITLSEKCGSCNMQQMCIACAGRAECETGAADGTPEYICRFMEEIKAAEK